MKFQLLKGKYTHLYVKIIDISTKADIELHDYIKRTLTRKEYMPFINSFDKTITECYLLNDIYFYYSFWTEVKTKIKEYTGKEPELELVNNPQFETKITREQFDEFVSNLVTPDFIKTEAEEYKFQQDAAFKAIKNKIGKIEVGTSGGKTFITYLYCKYLIDNIIENNKKILIIVPSKLLAKQLKEDFTEYQKFEDMCGSLLVETIYSGAKKQAFANIVCGTYQSLSDYDKEYFDDFRVVICDEVHRAKAYSIRQNIYNKITNADYFFGMSGTYPKYNSLDWLHLTAMFGPTLLEHTVKKLIDSGVSTPVKIEVIKISYPEDKDFVKNLKEDGIVGTDKLRAEKEFFQSYEKRTELACKLLKAYPSNSLILVDTVEYCHRLETYIQRYFDEQGIDKEVQIIHGNVSNRDIIIQMMKDAESDFILIGTYGTMSTGVSINNINQLYFLDGGKSEIRIRQSIGRGIRLHPTKEYCRVFDFYDYIPYSSFSSHARERMKIYQEQKIPYHTTEISI